MHSATKYICGHTDVLGGFLITNNEDWQEKINYNLQTMGTNMAVFEAYLLLRSLKTLKIRVEEHCFNARVVAEVLKEHDKIETFFFPGLDLKN